MDHCGPGDAWTVYLKLVQLHSEGATVLSSKEEGTLALPAGVRTVKTYSVMHFSSRTSSPASIKCFGQGNYESLLCLLFYNLSHDLATCLDPEVKLPRAEHIITCGVSHMKKVSSILAARGLKVTVLTAPGRVTSRSNIEP
jgi:hypothetical protein